MARRSIRCSCGADFIIPEVPPSLVHCPRCGEAIRLSAPGGGGSGNKVREDIREPIKPYKPGSPYFPLVLLVGAGVVIAGALITLIVAFSGTEVRRDPAFYEEVKAKPRVKVEEPVISIPSIRPVPESTRTAEKKPAPVEPPPPPPTPPADDPSDEIARGRVLASRLNLAGVLSTYYRLIRRNDELRVLQAVIEKDEREIRLILQLLQDRPEVAAMKARFQEGDVLTGFGTLMFDPDQPQRFASGIETWISTAQPGAAVMSIVRREGRTVTIPMWFPELPPDILRPDLRSGLPAAAVLPIPGETLAEVRRRTAGLAPYHRKTLPSDDAAKLDRLLQAGRGTADDLDFLRNRILAYCARSEAEIAGFASKVSTLESAVAASQSVDTVIFKDGRKIQGQIEDETEDSFRIKGRFGAMKAQKTEVLRIERGDALGTEFRRRYDAARGKPADLEALLAWCKEKNLPQQRELAAYALLVGDPGHDAAWTALGVAERLAPTSGPEFDVIWLTDGTRREGIITSETETAIHVDVLVRGAKSETIGTGKATIARSDITKIDRMNDAARKRAKDRALSFGDRARKQQEALARVVLVPETIHGVAGHRTSGTLFELHSTCVPAQVRETALMLEEMFNAYRRHFSVRRNAAKRIDVYFLANVSEYANFQQQTRGAVAPNPAYFDTQENHIVAYYGVQKDEEARLRAAILASEREIEDYKKKIAAEEDRIAREFRNYRQEFLDRVSLARKSVGPDPQSQAQIDRIKQENLNAIKAQERAAMDQLSKYRSQANQAITEHERVIRHNQAVLLAQTRAMYETLFHESFHAFAANFLWEEADNAGLPRWLHEGMATYFERSVVEAGELIHGGAHPGFLLLLRGLQRENKLMPVSTVVAAGAELFQIRHNGDIPRQEAAYAHAWGLAHYLLSRGVTSDQIETYVTDVSAGRNRIAAFEKLAGRKITDVEAEWRAHLNNLK
jgi:hypothetical protein